MKRRKFLQVVGAAAVATPLLSYAATKSPSNEVWKTRAEVEDIYRHKHNVLIVVPSGREADAIHKQMGRPRNVKVIGVGAMPCGYGADYIITDDECVKLDAPFGFYDEWHDQCVKPRLMPHGSHIQSRFRYEPRAYGFSALSMQFTDMDREEISSQAVDIPRQHLDDVDRVMAKALLYKWWIRQRGIKI